MIPISDNKTQTQTTVPARPGLTLPCGCRVELHNHHGIKVEYCQRHTTFTFSLRPDGRDVFYFVTEEHKP